MSDTQAPPPAPRSAARIIARNTAFGVGAQFALRITSFLFNVLVIRVLQPEAFGQYSIVLAWAGLFSVIGDMGINQYLAREIARDNTKGSELFWDPVVLRLILAAVASLITIAGAIALTDYGPLMITAILVYTTSYFLQALLAPLISLLTGNERIDITSVLSVVAQILFMVIAGIALLMGANFLWLIVASIVPLPIMTLLHWRAVRRTQMGPPRFRLNPQLWTSVLRAGFPFAVIQLSLSVAYQVDTIFLSQYVSNEIVGWYNTAYHLTLTLLTLSRTFNNAILPTLAREHAKTPESIRPWYFTSVRMMAFIGLPIAVGGSITAPEIINLLYGPAFAPAAFAFIILIWDLPIVMYTSFCGNITSSIREEKIAARIYLTVGIMNVVLNALLIPQLGILGACFATLITDAFSAMSFYAFFRRYFGAGLQFRRLSWLVLSAGIMGFITWIISDWNLLVIISISGTVYVTLVWFIGGFDAQERLLLLRGAGRIARVLKTHIA